MLGDITKVVMGGVAFAGIIFGGSAANDALTNSPSKCASGWAYNYAAEGDAVRETCYRAPWSVVLNADKSCNYGLDTSNPNATPVPCEEVPNWGGR